MGTSKNSDINKYLSVVSDKKRNILFVTLHKIKGNSYKNILYEGQIVVDNVEGRLLRAGAKSTESLGLKPATLLEPKQQHRHSSMKL